MNKLRTWDDGSYMPVWQKDLEFIQDALGAPLVKLCETLLGKTTGIICGCRYRYMGGVSTITEGLVLMEGEIVYCPAQSVLGNLNALEKQDFYDEAGDKVFRVDDGTDVRQTYYTPRAILTNGFSLDPSIEQKLLILNEEGRKTLLTCLFEEFFARLLVSPTVDVLFEPLYEKGIGELFGNEIITVNQSGQYGSVNMRYKKVGKIVYVLALSGAAGGDDGGGGDPGGSMNNLMPFTFPVNFRPAVTTFFSYHKNNDMANVSLGKVETDGKIYVRHISMITAIAFNFLIQ